MRINQMKEVKQKKDQNLKKGVILSIITAFIFSVMNLLVKYISQTIPTNEIGFFRGLFGVVFVGILMSVRKITFSKKERGWLLLRGLVGSMYVVVSFFALSVMPLGDLNILVQLSGLFVIFFSWVFLKEKLSIKIFPYVILILIGAIIVINPFSISSYTVYSLLGVLGAVIAALVSIIVRRLSMYGEHHPYEIIFYFLAVVMIVTGILSIKNFVIPTPIDFFWLFLMSLVSVLAQIFFTEALGTVNAIVVEIVRYIGVIFNTFWGVIIFRDIIGLRTIIGGVLLIGASIQLSRMKLESNKSPSK